MLRNNSSQLVMFVLNFLNEVLSLNAQECTDGTVMRDITALLNEVLSLNAQE